MSEIERDSRERMHSLRERYSVGGGVGQEGDRDMKGGEREGGRKGGTRREGRREIDVEFEGQRERYRKEGMRGGDRVRYWPPGKGEIKKGTEGRGG